MREIVHVQAGQCGNQIGAKVRIAPFLIIISSIYDVARIWSKFI